MSRRFLSSWRRLPGGLNAIGLCAWALALSAGDSPAPAPWNDYRVVMWMGDSAYKQPAKLPLVFQRLREMGVNCAMVHGAGGDPQPLLENKFPYYVENIINQGLCLKWNAQVRDWDKFVTAWAQQREESAFVREYCLEDPQWRNWAREQMRLAARKHGPHQPLAYDIRDELSVTISANPFDYDFSPLSLARFREWLQTSYGSLEALNRQWETSFASWEDAKPFSTDQIKNRLASGEALPRGRPDWAALQRTRFASRAARQALTRWNFSPWADFRTFMDISLAGALADLRRAAREVDPRTPVGIEGTQMPHAFGGYDLWRLAQAIDWVEPYDIGNAREIFGSFLPGKTILTTVFESETNPARRRLWHLVLQGDRGCIIWWSEDCLDWQKDDYPLTAKARALAPALQEMTSPLAKLFLRARRLWDPVFIHYSQPSIQVDWLIESCVDGSTWHRRFSSHEAEHNRMAKVRNSWLKVFQDLGYSPRFVPGTELADLAREQSAVLVLPTSRAMSDPEIAALKGFLEPGRGAAAKTVFCDGSPGLFDARGRLRFDSPLDAQFPLADSEERSYARRSGKADALATKAGDVAAYAQARLAAEPNLDWAEWVASNAPAMPREVTVPTSARVAVYRYSLGQARLLAFERNIDYHMSEDLKQAGGNQHLEQPLRLSARLNRPAHLYDLRARSYLGQTQELTFTVDPWQPSLFAALPEKIPAERLLDYLAEQ